MTRHEVQKLASIFRALNRSGFCGEPMDQLATLIANAAIDLVTEDEVNTALEQIAKGTADDPKQRPV